MCKERKGAKGGHAVKGEVGATVKNWKMGKMGNWEIGENMHPKSKDGKYGKREKRGNVETGTNGRNQFSMF